MTRVLFVSTMYPANAAGFRGVFIRNLLFALARAGGLDLRVWAPPGELPADAAAVTTTGEAEWLSRLIARGGISHVLRSGGPRGPLAALHMLRMLASAYRRTRDVEIYHLNWLQCALPLPRNGKPALISVLGNDLKLLRLPFMRLLLRRVMRKREVAICPNAEWMHEPLQEAFGDVARIRPVSFGIDPLWYAVQRDAFSAGPKLWIVVARLTADKLGPLFDWSKDLFVDPATRQLHLFGPMEQDIEIPDWVHYHGPAAPAELAQQWFPKACGLVSLSRHAEGRPQVMLEAMAAGLPIVASRMDAHASIVADGASGLLCDTATSYAHALAALEDRETNQRFGVESRRLARARMGTWDDCARRYLAIYDELLGHADD